MKKRLITLIAALSLAGVISAADNKSVPHVFSSGTTISSSQMNENFEFVANVFRKTTVDCNNGETIADAINNGYNHITISGTCYGPIHVITMDITPFGLTDSDLANKPVSRLVIKGAEASRASKILPNSSWGGLNSMVATNGVLQLINLTFNDSINANDNSLLALMDVTYEVTDSNKENRISAYGSSKLDIGNSTINATVTAGESSYLNIKSTSISRTNEPALYLSENSHAEVEDQSVINGRLEIQLSSSVDMSDSTVNGTVEMMQNSSLRLHDVIVNGDGSNNRTLKITGNSNASLWGATQVNGFAGEDHTVWVWKNSSIDLHDTTNISAPSGARAIVLQQNSGAMFSGSPTVTAIDQNAIILDTNSSVELNDNFNLTTTSSTESEIWVDGTSTVNINNNSSWVGDIGCGSINSSVNTGGATVYLDSNCNGYENLSSGGGSGSRSVYDGNNNRIGEFISYISSGEILARSDDGFMFKINTQEGYISGLPSNMVPLYYASVDCSGEPYIQSSSFSSPKDVVSFISYSDSPPSGVLYYSLGESEYLVYQSQKSLSNDSCSPASSGGTTLMMKIYPNDSAVTGVSSFTFTTPILLD